ncbi:MAG: hypothetical protein OEQ14_09420 [Gammaproteobacteria bacterium]|nr:hypothetical protein [Gammaproteobacteria bacterium]
MNLIRKLAGAFVISFASIWPVAFPVMMFTAGIDALLDTYEA